MEPAHTAAVRCPREVLSGAIRQLSHRQRRHIRADSHFLAVVYVWRNVGIKLMNKGNPFAIRRQAVFRYLVGTVQMYPMVVAMQVYTGQLGGAIGRVVTAFGKEQALIVAGKVRLRTGATDLFRFAFIQVHHV